MLFKLNFTSNEVFYWLLNFQNSFWRIDEFSDEIINCDEGHLHSGVCSGGNKTGNDLCYEGYLGPAC